MAGQGRVFFGAAAEYFRRLVGGDVEPDSDVVTVGTTSVVIVPPDGERVQLTIINNSPNDVYLGMNEPAVSGQGIFLASNGGAVSMSVNDDGTLPAQAWNAIASVAGSKVSFVSLRRFNQEG